MRELQSAGYSSVRLAPFKAPALPLRALGSWIQGVFPIPWQSSRVGAAFYLSGLQIARAAWGPHNQQGAQMSVPETLWIQLPHHPPHSGFGEASDQRALGLGDGMGKRRAECESNPHADPTSGAVAAKKPQFLSLIAASSIGGF